jgi:hypothetical protein
VNIAGDPLHTTRRPYDDGNYGYNVNGHGRDSDTLDKSFGNAAKPISAACTACHDILQPPGTHFDGVLNGRLTPTDTRNANSFHLVAGYLPASPANDQDVQLTFDAKCYSTCHQGASVTNMRHALAAELPQYAMEMGIIRAPATQPSSYILPLNSAPPEMFYDRNLRTLGAYEGPVNYIPCVSCHNPHGTDVVSPRGDGNNKMVIYRWQAPALLCSRCHP